MSRNLAFLSVVDRLAVQSELVESGCIEWRGSLNAKGYGKAVYRGQQVMVHRIAYIVHVGEIPPGLEIHHLCRNRCCINPVHLEPVTHLENIRRIPRTECRQGHPFTPENTINRPDGGRKCRACHKERETRYRRDASPERRARLAALERKYKALKKERGLMRTAPDLPHHQ